MNALSACISLSGARASQAPKRPSASKARYRGRLRCKAGNLSQSAIAERHATGRLRDHRTSGRSSFQRFVRCSTVLARLQAAGARRRPRPQRNPGSRSGRAGARRRTASLFAIQFRASDFCFVICGLSRGDPRSGAIDLAGFPNPCYRCSWFSKKAARRGRKRGGHGLRDGSSEAAAAQPVWQGVAAGAHLRLGAGEEKRLSMVTPTLSPRPEEPRGARRLEGRSRGRQGCELDHPSSPRTAIRGDAAHRSSG